MTRNNLLKLTVGDIYYTLKFGATVAYEGYRVLGFFNNRWVLGFFGSDIPKVISINYIEEGSFHNEWFKTKKKIKELLSELNHDVDIFNLVQSLDFSSLNHPSTSNREEAETLLNNGAYFKVARSPYYTNANSWFIVSEDEYNVWLGEYDYVLIAKCDMDIFKSLLKAERENNYILVEDNIGNQYSCLNTFVENYNNDNTYHLVLGIYI